MIITKTPFRMSFFGGGTDMPSFFRENGGSVLSTTFDKYCYGLKPYLYLTYVLERLRQLGPFPKSEELDSLLPWAEALPEEIETKTKPKK